MDNATQDVTPTRENAPPTQEKQNFSRREALNKLADEIQDAHTKDYVKNRLLNQIGWYSKKSGDYKKQYHTWMYISIVLGALIPVASLLLEGPLLVQILIALLGSAVTAVNACLSLNNSKELWLTYRNTEAFLVRTLYFYFNNAEEFASVENKDARLVEVCEAEMSRENGTWLSMFHDGKVTKSGS